MKAQLESFLKSKASFTHDELELVMSHFRAKKVKRKEVLVRAGDIARHFYFVQSGCLRLYEIDSKGNDVTAFFALEGDIITTVPSFLHQKPSRDFLVAYEATELMTIGREDFYKLVDQVRGFAHVQKQTP